MKPYMFVINATPMPDSKPAKIVSKAFVHCWVIADNADMAEVVAFAYIRKYLWEPKEIEHAFEIDPEQVSGFHKDEQLLYQKALRYGVAADFLTGLDEQGNLPEGSHLKIDLGKLLPKE